MFKALNEKRFIFPLLGALFLMFLLLSLFAEGTYDAGDGIRHYLVSRYSWKHPDLLLYSWGKPFFTIISSPFSQFGIMGVITFNIICALLSSWFCYKIAQKLNLRYAFLVIPFLCFTPCYFPVINSGLTEPLFGLTLIASIYLMMEKRYLWACIFISFLPYVRSEGLLILPLFFVILIWRKKFWYSPLLAFGTVLYSIVGSFYYHDILWIKNQNPYNGANKAFYGQGELLHFVNNHNFIWGTLLGILFVAGCLYLLVIFLLPEWAEKTGKVSPYLTEEIILIAGSFCIYFVAHSIMWWKGLANSLGLLRVIAGIIPCSALLCLRGFNLFMIPILRKNKFVEAGIIAVILFFVIRSPFKHEYFPYKLDQEQAVIKDAGDWFLTSPFKKQKVYYLYPYLAHVLNVDSFDPNKVAELWGLYPTIKEWGISAVPDSTLVFWDAHFGPNECRIPLDTIMNDPHFELIKTFKPKEPFQTLGGYNFQVCVFMKTNNAVALEKLDSVAYDFESTAGLEENVNTIIAEKAHSGTHSVKLTPAIEYSVAFKKPLSSFNAKELRSIDLKAKIWSAGNDLQDNKVVLSIDDAAGKNMLWDGQPITLPNEADNAGWKNVSIHFTLNADLANSKNILKIYFWNKGKKEFYIDDVSISYQGKK